MKVRFIFYRAKFEWRSFLRTRKVHLVDDLINVWTCIINLPVVVWEERSINPRKWGAGVWQFICDCYAHVEIWTPDINGNFEVLYKDLEWDTLRSVYVGTCWTSTMRKSASMIGKKNGTCCRPAAEVLIHPERWDVKEYEVSAHDYKRGIFWMEYKVRRNKGYSLRDTGKFFGLGFLADAARDICSEFCHNAGVIFNILTHPFRVVSPRWLNRMLPGETHKPVEA